MSLVRSMSFTDHTSQRPDIEVSYFPAVFLMRHYQVIPLAELKPYFHTLLAYVLLHVML